MKKIVPKLAVKKASSVSIPKKIIPAAKKQQVKKPIASQIDS